MVDSVSRPSSGGRVGLSRIVATDLVLLLSSFLLMYTFDVIYDTFLHVKFICLIALKKKIEILLG